MLPALTALAPTLASPTVATLASSSASTIAGVGDTFTQLLSGFTSRAVNTVSSAEATSINALQGKASLQQVVDGITAAEQALQTALAVRDKAVSAWQDVSRMSI